jgi:amino acid adenylation domain-containing protein/non-ribosomal peptide synthase protein (TIGR01720 family)
MTDLSKTIAKLSPEKRRLLEKVLRRQGVDLSQSVILAQPRNPIGDPLSHAQQRLWFLDRLAPGSSFYNVSQAIRLHGAIDPAALSRTFVAVVQRHEMLRTRFGIHQGEPVQLVSPAPANVLAWIDLRGLPPAEREAEMLRLIGREARRPFDLATGPLFRALAMQLAPEEHAVLLTLHHVVSDGWSMDVLIREIVTLYAAFAAGRTSPLPELPIQYADFAIWQRQWLQGDRLESQLAYWKQQLGGVAVLDLPTDQPRPPKQTFFGSTVSTELADEPLLRDFQALARRQEATLFMAALAACQALFQRYSAQTDIAVGTPISGRNQVQLEGLIGFFVNTLVVRTDLGGSPGFSDLLDRVRQVTLAAYAHQDVPFEKLVGDLQPERDQSRPPLFQVMFGLETAAPAAAPIPGVRLEPIRFNAETAKFDLTLGLQETATRLFCAAEYNRDLFDAPTIERLLRHFRTLLQQAVAAPTVPVAELPLLSPSEQQELVAEWNDTGAGQPLLLHEMVAGWAARTPGATAVDSGAQRLTYGDLDRRANQLARHLTSLGVGPGVPVGLCFERSAVEMVIGLLAVLKAGGAYLPLDPTYPEERLAYMTEDCGLLVQLTQESLVDVLPQSWGFTLCLDSGWDAVAHESEEPLPASPDADDLAYIIYTSGSTGQPKGVMVSHRGLGNLAREQSQIFRVEAGGQVLQFASLSFDASISEIAMALASGATLHLADRATLLPGPDLLALLRERRISTVTLPPAALAALPPHDLPDLHTLAVAGEACALDVAQRWGLGRRLVNAYGPTEATVCATCAVFEGRFDRLPIGRPIAGVQVYLLDSRLQPVPAGVKGELYLGGIGLARGYWGRPDLTAAAFLPSPFSAAPGARLYRTGDLGRLLPDGRIELLGRVDSQIKLRGYRIELGEIAAALDSHAAVREAAVLLREDHPGERRIVAYVVPNGEVTVEELRSALEAKLPAYMVPAFFVLLEALPRLPNDKVDRRALPRPEGQSAAAASTYVAPRNREEEVLATIWSQVLRLPEVSIHQNFFEAGGDSILGIQVIFRAGQEGLRLTPGQLFEHPTIAGLATVAERMEEGAAETGPVAGPVPLTPVQHWFFAQELPHPEHFNQSLLFAAGMRIDPALLARAVDLLLTHHDALRMRYEPPAEVDGSWRQRNEAPGAPPPVIHIDLAALPSERLSPAIEAFASQLQASLDLAAGPLVRVALFSAAAGEPDRLFLVVHHLVVDGVSWRVLLGDLEAVYGQLAHGEEPVLPGKTTSFQRWAERLAELARSPQTEAEAAYWLQPARREAPPLPIDHSHSNNTVASARAVSVALSEEETRALLQEVPRAYHTQINDALLTALAEALAPWMGQRRVLIDLEGHGREEIADDVDVSRTVGYFTAIFPVLLDLEGIASPGESLKAVKEQMRRLPGRGLGYGLLRYLGSEETRRRFAGLPAAGLAFNYFGQLDQVVAGSSLFGPARESAGETRNPLQPRPYLLEVSASVRGGRLRVVWLYSESRHLRSTIEALGARFIEALRGLIAHCLSPEAGGYTPSDFPLARLQQRQLDRVAQAAGGRIEDLYPLSPMQQGMLFQTLQEQGSGVYVGQLGFDLNAELNVAAFERTWSRILERHPILRTAFYWRGLDDPVQAVLPKVTLSWDRQDWRDVPADEQRARLDAYLQEDRRRGFDLGDPPLLRLALIRLGDERHRVIFSSHHLSFDGWSWAILLRELFTLYAAELRGAEPELGPVSPYRGYIAWLQEQDLGEAERFWRRTLAGFSTPTVLALGAPLRSRRAMRPYEKVSLRLPAETTEALRSLARRGQVTFNTLVQGAWSLLLHRYSGDGDVLFGAVTAGRSAPVPGIESMVGLFINTLPVRVKVADREGFSAWLRTLQEEQAEARRYEHSSLTDVHGWSDVPRSKPLFETLLTFENYPVDDSVQEQIGQGLRPSRVEFVDQTNFPLTVVAGARARLDLEILYDVRRYDADGAARMLQHLGAVFLGMLEAAGGTVGDLPLLTPAERHQALIEWSAAQMPAASTIFPRLFEAQAARTPTALAVVFGESALTYAELDARANQLAHYLRRCGVGPDVPVGIYVERSLEMIVALLGVLKAGGGYVPLDPSYPADRLAYMMEDCGMLVILSQESLAGSLPQTWGITVLLDSDWETIAQEPTEPCGAAIDPDDLAYVIYTSGSTGRPKGVMVTHRGLGNLAVEQARLFRVGPESRVLQFASLSFDASISEIVTALVSGAALHLAGGDVLLAGADLLHILRERRITTVTLPPAVLPGLPAEELPDLVTLIVAGEACPLPLAKRWAVGRRFINAYGPTETTVCASLAPYEEGFERLPIGRPLPGAQVYLLDKDFAPVPARIQGDLYIGGIGLARGYWGRPDLTAAAFLPDPLSTEPGARLYKTGDLGLHQPDGAIDFLGRADSQIKLRGFRIELEEIEAALRAAPRVRDAAATLQETPAGSVVAAWIVPEEGTAPDADDLRQALRERLPEYMIPAHFTLLSRMPLTPSGKLDRKALAQSAALPMGSGAAAEAPRTPTEELVAGLFCEVLKAERVGMKESFFDLGGHSLLATQLVSRIGLVFDLELPIQTVFDNPTVSSLAAALDTARAAAGAVRAPDIVPVPRDQPLPLSFSQQRLWFLDQLAPGSNAYNLPAAFRLDGELDIAALRTALSELARRHEALRTTFAGGEGEPVQVIGPCLPVPVPVVDLSALPAAEKETETARWVSLERRLPFDLGRGPVFRVSLLTLDEREHVILLTMHHIVSDGWSMGVLVRELLALYAAFSQQRPPSPASLPELPVQYADFAVWQRQYLSGEVLEAELGYWRERLGMKPPVLELPTDRPRPAVQTFAGANQPVRLSPSVLAGLQALARQQGATLFMTLLAAFEVLLQRYSGQDDLIVGTPVAGRNRIETEGLIGFFVNMLVLRTNLADQAGHPLAVGELLGRVRETALAAYAHQDLPFEKLVVELQPERDLSRTPLFQVVFTLQNAPAGDLAVPGVAFRPLAAESTTAKFDLTLSLAEGGFGLAGAVEYNRDLFDAATARRMAGHLAVLLERLADPSAGLLAVAELPLLTAAERQELLDWNDTAKPCPQVPLVHELFSAHARRRPEAPAISSPRGALTYGEVEARSNRLAHHLQSLGVGPETLVAICMERTLERAVAIVAVLKAGGAYVSLDPTYPRERLAFLLEDAKAPVLLTESRFAAALPETAAVLLRMDEDWPTVHGDDENPPESGVGPDNLSYVVYTSGSTGKPKGVEIPHAGLMNLVRWHQDLYEVKPEDRGTQIASPAFDASIWELWPYFAAGASVHVPDEETRLSSAGMVRWWSEQGITLAYLMTPLAEGVLEEEIPEDLPLHVRALIIGGDRLHRGPSPGVGFRLMNHYGPAEYTVTSTVVEVPPQGEISGIGIPTIGRPVDNTRIYVLDRRGQPVPVGVPGELYVAGLGLARGYMHRPDMTAEKFVPDPFAPQWGETGSRMYRTADLVRRLPDGDLDFLGRLDHQVKIRGLRIELGEIETVLGQHPDLREVAVLVREDRPGDKRLTAYAVPSKPEAPPSAADLRRFLLERLPEYMVPAAFVFLDALPLTSNGKVDRRALPEPSREGEDLTELVAPRDALELELVGIWQSILGRQPIGVRDNFFSLGGHSLLAVRLIAILRQRFQWTVPLAALFQEGTVEGLARVLRDETQVVAESPLVTLQDTGSRPPLYFIHPAGGGLQGYKRLVQHLGTDQPVHGFRARGLASDDPPRNRIEEMAAAYAGELRRFQPQGPYHLGGSSMGALVAFEMARQLRETGAEVGLVLLIDPPEPNLEPFDGLDKLDDVAILALFASDFGLSFDQDEIRALDPDQRLASLVGQAIEAGIVPAGTGLETAVEFLRRSVNVFRAGAEAAFQYIPGTYAGPVTLLCAAEMPNGEPKPQGDGGWSRHCPVTVSSVPGNHNTVLREPHVRTVAELLHRLLPGAA